MTLRASAAPPRVGQSTRFWAFLSATAVSVTGDCFALIALPFAILEVGSATDVGLVLGARTLAMMLFLLLGGAIGDRVSRRTLLITSNLIRFPLQFATAALLLVGGHQLVVLVILQAIYGLASAVYLPSTNGLIQELVGPEDRQRANGKFSLATSLATTVGPAVAAGLLLIASPAVCVFLDGFSFLIAAVLLAVLPKSEGRQVGGSRLIADLIEGWSIFRRIRWLWSGVVFFAFFQFLVVGSYYVGGPVVIKAQFGGASSWGAIMAASGVGAILAGVVATRVTFRRPLATCYLCLLLIVPALLSLAMAAPIYWQLPAHAAMGAAMALAGALWETKLQGAVPAEAISRVSAYDWLGSMALRPIGLILAGPTMTLIGAREMFLSIAGMLAVGACWMGLATLRPEARTFNK